MAFHGRIGATVSAAREPSVAAARQCLPAPSQLRLRFLGNPLWFCRAASALRCPRGTHRAGGGTGRFASEGAGVSRRESRDWIEGKNRGAFDIGAEKRFSLQRPLNR